jgi:hypothetical protein
LKPAELLGRWCFARAESQTAIESIDALYVHAVQRWIKDSMNDDAGREIAIFTGALKLTLRKRATFLDIACHGDEPLRCKVEALLSAHDRIGNFLEEPPTGESIE